VTEPFNDRLKRVAPELDPEHLAAWCRSIGRPAPEEMAPPRQQLLLVWLSYASNRATVQAWKPTVTA
jgi:hypothetical protein